MTPTDEQCGAIAREVYREQGRPSWLTMPIVPHDVRMIRAAFAAGAASVPRYRQVAWRQVIDSEALNISHIYRDSMPLFSEKWEPVYVIDAATGVTK